MISSSLSGQWICRTPGALCLENLSHVRVGEVAAAARRIVGFILTLCLWKSNSFAQGVCVVFAGLQKFAVCSGWEFLKALAYEKFSFFR
jgi:hypothetical protein